jgi:hypothetical protein
MFNYIAIKLGVINPGDLYIWLELSLTLIVISKQEFKIDMKSHEK